MYIERVKQHTFSRIQLFLLDAFSNSPVRDALILLRHLMFSLAYSFALADLSSCCSCRNCLLAANPKRRSSNSITVFSHRAIVFLALCGTQSKKILANQRMSTRTTQQILILSIIGSNCIKAGNDNTPLYIY